MSNSTNSHFLGGGCYISFIAHLGDSTCWVPGTGAPLHLRVFQSFRPREGGFIRGDVKFCGLLLDICAFIWDIFVFLSIVMWSDLILNVQKCTNQSCQTDPVHPSVKIVATCWLINPTSQPNRDQCEFINPGDFSWQQPAWHAVVTGCWRETFLAVFASLRLFEHRGSYGFATACNDFCTIFDRHFPEHGSTSSHLAFSLAGALANSKWDDPSSTDIISQLPLKSSR